MAAARSPRRKKKPRNAPGTAPGTIVGDPSAPKPVIRLIAYGPTEVVEKAIAAPEELSEFRGRFPVIWVNVDGLGDSDVIKRFGSIFGLHRLALEDVVNVHQRAKVDQFGDHLFVVARSVDRLPEISTEQISLFLGKDFVLSFQERAGDCFDPIRARIRNGVGRLRHAGPDYLAYALLDAIVDSYFPILEEASERLEDLEDELLREPKPDLVARIHRVRRDLLTLRRAIWPKREAIGTLYRDPLPLVADETRLYLRDCYDHTTQIIDLLETNRELGADLSSLYLVNAGNRLNEVMKVLTIIATIFMPLSFIASVYGMNFHNLPELEWRYGYLFALVVMALVALTMIAWFWRRGWFRSTTHFKFPGDSDGRGPNG